MKKGNLNGKELSLKFLAFGLVLIIVISSISITKIMIISYHEDDNEIKTQNEQNVNYEYQKRSIEIKTIATENGEWISFDNDTTPPGTPANAHVSISDTSGITIVADFYGFWRNEYTIDTTLFDDLNMPGAGSLCAYGKPMLPYLFEYVQIPYDVDISIKILASSSTTENGYNIRPAPPSDIPVAIGYSDENMSTTTPIIVFDPVYSNNAFFPGTNTSTEGELNSTSMIMRGHRILGLSFYPVQYNPMTGNLTIYSQFIVKVKYSFPAQIKPVPENLRSEIFERIIEENVLNCYKSLLMMYPLGVVGAGILPYPIFFEGAEYLIITNRTFEAQAQRLAQWKERKGIPSSVHVIPDGITDVKQHVKDYIEFVYYRYYPAPTYVLLMGDVETIPANYDVDHDGEVVLSQRYERIFESEHAKIASDLGYFNVEGNGYFPDMIYSRISVDTELQAEIIVNKTLQYEQSPPTNTEFYKNYMSAGLFNDEVDSYNRPFQDGVEDVQYQFIYTLERIGEYLSENLGYNTHINYSAWCHPFVPGSRQPEYFQQAVNPSDPTTIQVVNVLPTDFVWLWGYDWSGHLGRNYYYELERANVTPNFNEGRFLVLYYGHGGSKNMFNPYDTLDGWGGMDYRDPVEGWHHPCLNTSFFADLTNGNLTPLVISIACNTGWFDGETDEDHLDRDYVYTNTGYSETMYLPTNPFSLCENECFAENITRLDGGGAIAAISSSRPAYAGISAHLLNGLIRAFWPGFLGSMNQPIYEMGGALLFSKIYAIREWSPEDWDRDYNQRRTTFEEYHLFGDPETQLWTDVPSHLTVEYPSEIGIGTQRFVVTVTSDSFPVPYAKICLQKDSDVYQVGYTDPQGQVIFTVNPSYPGLMNLTVTKHNYIPYIGELMCICSAAIMTLTPSTGHQIYDVNFNVHGFYDTEDVEIYYESDYSFSIPAGSTTYTMPGPSVRTGFVNVIAKGIVSNQVTVALFRCLSDDPKPDLYIFNRWDESTWGPGVSGDDIGWSNPDIAVYNGDTPVTLAGGVYPTITYAVSIIVHNQGDAKAIDTTVTLWYAEIGGGVSWDYAGDFTIPEIPIDQAGYAWIYWTPESDGVYCLKVEISNERDRNLNNNVGALAVTVMEYSSPAKTDFYIGNPTDTDDYVFICVRQQGNHSDVWNATVMHYFSQVIKSHENVTISLQVDPGPSFEGNESRFFVADIYVKCQLVGGLSFIVSRVQQPTSTSPDPFMMGIVLGIGIGMTLTVIVLVGVMKRKK